MIYFAHAIGTDLVKIGVTAGEPERRVADLQTGCPHKIELLLTLEGGEAEEAAWHRDLAAYRVQGEWFRLSVASLLRILGAFRAELWELALWAVGVEERIKRLEGLDPAPQPARHSPTS